MKRVLVMVIVFLALGASAEVSKGAKVKVNGMVCSFCTTSIEKKFREKSEVSDVKVDLDKKLVTVSFASGEELADEQIKEIITKSGYTVVGIEKEK